VAIWWFVAADMAVRHLAAAGWRGEDRESTGGTCRCSHIGVIWVTRTTSRVTYSTRASATPHGNGNLIESAALSETCVQCFQVTAVPVSSVNCYEKMQCKKEQHKKQAAAAAAVFLLYLGLDRTIYIRCIYGIFVREITKYMVIYGVYTRFWPTLTIFHLHIPAPCMYTHG